MQLMEERRKQQNNRNIYKKYRNRWWTFLKRLLSSFKNVKVFPWAHQGRLENERLEFEVWSNGDETKTLGKFCKSREEILKDLKMRIFSSQNRMFATHPRNSSGRLLPLRHAFLKIIRKNSHEIRRSWPPNWFNSENPRLTFYNFILLLHT